MTPTRNARPAVLAGLWLATLAAWPLAAQLPTPPIEAQPVVELYSSVGLSVDQTPLTTRFADIIPVAVRVGVPVGRRGVEPWIGGAFSHVKRACAPADEPCPATDTRVLAGLAYRPPGLGGLYTAAGVGVRSFGGSQGFAHSLLLGVAFPATRYIAPGFELRAENYEGFQELLMIAAVVRLSWPR